jgi:uroporphyrinogen decarboxylase
MNAKKTIVPCRPPFKGTMTARERFHNQMHYQPFDRTYNMEFGYWEENFQMWNIFVENNITNNDEADVFFNFDRMKIIGGRTWLLPPFPSAVISETETTKIVMNSDGLTAEVPKGENYSTIPHFMKASIVTPEDWKRCKEERMRLDDPARKINVEAIKKEHPDDRTYPLGFWTGSMIGKIRDMLTFEGLAYAIYDYPEMLEDMVETCCQLVEQSIDRILPYVKVDLAAGWEDICFKNGPIVSVDFFKNVVAPRYKRIHKKLLSYGVDIWYIDCDGDVRPILKYFIENGVNTLFPWEVNGSGHPADALKEYGKELRIMGGVDKIELAKGPRAIKAYLETLVPLVERGGYIPFCDHRCPPNVKPEDYIYYLDLKEQMFGMK